MEAAACEHLGILACAYIVSIDRRLISSMCKHVT